MKRPVIHSDEMMKPESLDYMYIISQPSNLDISKGAQNQQTDIASFFSRKKIHLGGLIRGLLSQT